VFYGTDELLAGEAAELGRRAQAAGNDVLVRAVEGGQHAVQARPRGFARHSEVNLWVTRSTD
jgi:epsilon-lactone hydrolase